MYALLWSAVKERAKIIMSEPLDGFRTITLKGVHWIIWIACRTTFVPASVWLLFNSQFAVTKPDVAV